MKIQVCGPGCKNCTTTEKNVIDACAEMNLSADISHVFDIKEFMKLGVMRTPAIIVNGKVILSGRVPSVADVKKILSDLK